MANQPTEAVIAGSKGFALALLAPLTERVGTRPRIAADPAQALELTGGNGLVVVEFQGDRSLDAIRRLLEGASGLAVIAAVPDGNAGATEALRLLGVDAAPWNGRPDAVLNAVSRRLGTTRPQAAFEAPPAPPAASAPAAPAPASAVGALFDDMDLKDEPPVAAPAGAGLAAPLAQPAAARGDWPATVPSAGEAADALASGIAGVFAPAGSPLAIVAEVMAGMSPLERAVLLGEPQPIDAEPVRRAAIMRVRVAVALASAPPPGAPVDVAAVSALLGEIDALLTQVNALAASAPPELQPIVEQVRNEVVKEAIDFSEVAHRVGSEAAAGEHAAAGATAAARRATRARIVSVASDAERAIEREETHHRRLLYVVFALACLGAGSFHGYRYYRVHAGAGAERPTRAGVPADATIVPAAPGAPIVIRSKGGRAFTAEELKRIEDEEGLRGNAVSVAGPSLLIVVPGAAAGGVIAPGLVSPSGR
jgi:hypothetical protein